MTRSLLLLAALALACGGRSDASKPDPVCFRIVWKPGDDRWVYLTYLPIPEVACSVETGLLDAGTSERGVGYGNGLASTACKAQVAQQAWEFTRDGGTVTAVAEDAGAVETLTCAKPDGGAWP